MFDTTPKPSFLRALHNQKWTVAGALSELVDNAFGSGRGNADNVWIDYDATGRILDVLDDGRGMDGVGRLFQLGNTIGRAPGDIGIYGSGGTMAIIWLPHHVEVYTLREGQVSYHRRSWAEQFSADHFFPVDEQWRDASPRNTPAKLLALDHGTLIRLRLSSGRHVNMHNVMRDIARVYAPGIRNGKQIMWRIMRRGQKLETHTITDPFRAPSDPNNLVTFNIVLALPNEHLAVNGCIGLIDGLPFGDSLVAIGYGHRNILRTREFFQSPDGSQKYTGLGITGWLQLEDGWQPYLSVTKDAIQDDNIWDALRAHVFNEIQPLLQKTEEREHKVLFDEIAVGLLESINGLSNVHVDIERGKIPPPGDLPGSESKGGSDMPSRPSPDDGEGATDKTPAISCVTLTEASDAEMCGTLVSAAASKSELVVIVNIDHPWMVDALRKPVNRPALNYAVVREISKAICGDREFLRRLFKPSMLQVIETKSESDKEGFVARLLLDKTQDENVRGASR